MALLDSLTAQVTANTNTINSAITLINGIADRITAAGTDPTQLAALVAELKADDDNLAAAVTANTPAASATAAPATSTAPAAPSAPATPATPQDTAGTAAAPATPPATPGQ